MNGEELRISKEANKHCLMTVALTAEKTQDSEVRNGYVPTNHV